MSSSEAPLGLADLDAYVLCGGQGTRLRGAVPGLPKALAPVGGRPFLDIVLEYWSGVGLRRFVLCVGYRASAIQERRAELEKYGEIVFSCETEPLGTGGAWAQAVRTCGRSRTCVGMNGDSLATVALADMLDWHREVGARATLAVVPGEAAPEGGAIEREASGRIASFHEKGSLAAGRFCNAGVYLVESEWLAAEAGAFSLEHDFFPKWIPEGLHAFVHRGSLLDIGTPERYDAALGWLRRHTD